MFRGRKKTDIKGGSHRMKGISLVSSLKFVKMSASFLFLETQGSIKPLLVI